MVKLISALLGIAITVICFSGSIYSTNIEIKHDVARIDEFVVNAKSVTSIEKANKIEIAHIEVKNNTRDGYKVELETVHGVLKPVLTGDGDGEINIPYVFVTEGASGTAPSGSASGFRALTIPEAPPTIRARILGVESKIMDASQLLSDPTDTAFRLFIRVDDADSFINMAGTYTDTVSITYTDF